MVVWMMVCVMSCGDGVCDVLSDGDVASDGMCVVCDGMSGEWCSVCDGVSSGEGCVAGLNDFMLFWEFDLWCMYSVFNNDCPKNSAL